MSAWQLVAVEDLRPYDWESGQRTEEIDALGARCPHCKADAPNPIIYSVQDDETGVALEVCASHCALACGGWEPTPKMIERRLKQLAKAVEAERVAAIQFDAEALAARVPVPPVLLAELPRILRSLHDGVDTPYLQEVRKRAEYLIRLRANDARRI